MKSPPQEKENNMKDLLEKLEKVIGGYLVEALATDDAKARKIAQDNALSYIKFQKKILSSLKK